MAESAESTSKCTQKFKWTIGTVDDLLGALKNCKSTLEYRNLDFNADKVKQYEAVRQTMHSHCGSNFENNYFLSKKFAPNPARPGLVHPM